MVFDTVGGVSLYGYSRTRRRRWRSFLLQQGGDVDVPADRLPVEATGEQVAGGVVFTPGGAAHHAPVTLNHDTQPLSTRRTRTCEVTNNNIREPQCLIFKTLN